jgi:hypothetical protein
MNERTRDTYDGSLYVIVNVSKRIEFLSAPGRHYVVPGEEPGTFGTLDEAAEALLDLMDEYDHSLETAPLFKLVPVPVDEVKAALARARDRQFDSDDDDLGTRRYPGAPPSCPECGDVRQATKTYDDAGLALCLNCNSAFEPMLIGQWVLGDVASYAVETEGGEWVTVRAVDMDHAEKLVLALGLTPVCVQEAEDGDASWQYRSPSPSPSTSTRVVHCKREPYDVYIGRPSKWGNPFRIGPDGTRQEVVAKYRAWIAQQPDLMAALPELEGKTLGCWCKPEACHGDVLVELVEQLGTRE